MKTNLIYFVKTHSVPTIHYSITVLQWEASKILVSNRLMLVR